MKENDRDYFVQILRHLELYTETLTAYELMTPEKLLDEKIIIWAIKEIYLSPYKMFLNNLNREKIVLKYQKTKKYITSKDDYRIEEIINYFVVCLYNELENGRG